LWHPCTCPGVYDNPYTFPGGFGDSCTYPGGCGNPCTSPCGSGASAPAQGCLHSLLLVTVRRVPSKITCLYTEPEQVQLLLEWTRGAQFVQ